MTYCPKNGELQGTPTLGPEGNSSEKGEEVNQSEDSEETTSTEYPSFSLAESPERVNSLNVNTLKGSSEAPERLHATALGTKRQIKTALRNEEEAENTRKGAVEALESRLDAIQGETSQEDVEEAVDEINGEVMPEDATDAEKNLASALLNSGAAEDLEEAKRKAGITA